VVGDAAGKAFFSLNKWHGFLLYFCQILLLLFLSPPAYRGGVERGVAPAMICRDRGGKGDSISEHIHAAGCCAAAIFIRQGGMSSTSTMEALLRNRHGCSNPICREVIRSPRRSGRPWWLLVTGKRLPSRWSRILDSSTSRTPAKGDGGVLGLDCKNTLCSRVVFVKKLALSIDRRFHRASLEKAAFNSVHVTVQWKISGSF
jgi:hypothetical protein